MPRAQYFSKDCAQMVGKMPVDVDMKIDCMSISGHKAGQKASVHLRPAQALCAHGAHYEWWRAGTGIAQRYAGTTALCGFGKACEIAMEDMESDHKWISYLSDGQRHHVAS